MRKSRPRPGDVLYIQCCGALQALDSDGHVDIVGVGVHWRAGCRIGRRDKQLTGVGFEVEFFGRRR